MARTANLSLRHRDVIAGKRDLGFRGHIQGVVYPVSIFQII